MSLSVVAIQPPAAIYREEQRFGWWAYALMAFLVALGWAMFEGRGPFGVPQIGIRGHHLVTGIAAGLVLFSVIIVAGFLRMTTLVTPTDVRVWFGFIPTYRRSIAIGTIARVEIIRYRPILDYGGWGIRVGRNGDRALNARGDRGVRLHLVDGSKIVIGSQRPEELALAVEGALRPGH